MAALKQKKFSLIPDHTQWSIGGGSNTIRRFRRKRLIIDLSRIKNSQEPVGGFLRWEGSRARNTALILIIILNLTAVWTLGYSGAFFSDQEAGHDNLFRASTLDLTPGDGADFSPLVEPDITAEKEVIVENTGQSDLNYDVAIDTYGGINLCSALNLRVYLEGFDNPLYAGPLMDFNLYNISLATSGTDVFTLESELPVAGEEYMDQECIFDLVFYARTAGLGQSVNGFDDWETIANRIASGNWSHVAGHIVINKVYKDVDCKHGNDLKNEWIELYNPTDSDVNLKKWKICDNFACAKINNNVSIPAGGKAWVAHDASTWKYWDMGPDPVLIHQLGGKALSLGDDSDMLILKDSDETEIDRMNWGKPNSHWVNFDANVWNPGATAGRHGHIIGRLSDGLDTDTRADWADLGLPDPATHIPGDDSLYAPAALMMPMVAQPDMGMMASGADLNGPEADSSDGSDEADGDGSNEENSGGLNNGEELSIPGTEAILPATPPLLPPEIENTFNGGEAGGIEEGNTPAVALENPDETAANGDSGDDTLAEDSIMDSEDPETGANVEQGSATEEGISESAENGLIDPGAVTTDNANSDNSDDSQPGGEDVQGDQAAAYVATTGNDSQNDGSIQPEPSPETTGAE